MDARRLRRSSAILPKLSFRWVFGVFHPLAIAGVARFGDHALQAPQRTSSQRRVSRRNDQPQNRTQTLISFMDGKDLKVGKNSNGGK